MRYVYYIIAIVIIFSGLTVYGIFDTRVEISKPFISVNDRIISHEEFTRLIAKKSPDMTKEQFVESIIDKQVLIQEAVKAGVNREESFRRSVENFYEQSLIKVLMDRKLQSLVVDVTDEELEKYERLLRHKVVIAKVRYKNFDDAKAQINGIQESIKMAFSDLSDDLKFIILNLEPGRWSAPQFRPSGIVVYRLDNTVLLDRADATASFDIKKVSVYLQDKKKERLMEEWIRNLRETADVWREK